MQQTRLDRLRKLIKLNNGTLATLNSFYNGVPAIMADVKARATAETSQDDADGWNAYADHLNFEWNILKVELEKLGLRQVFLKSDKCLTKIFLKEECGGLYVTELPYTGDNSKL